MNTSLSQQHFLKELSFPAVQPSQHHHFPKKVASSCSLIMASTTFFLKELFFPAPQPWHQQLFVEKLSFPTTQLRQRGPTVVYEKLHMSPTDYLYPLCPFFIKDVSKNIGHLIFKLILISHVFTIYLLI